MSSDFQEIMTAMKATTSFPDDVDRQLNASFSRTEATSHAMTKKTNEWTADGATLTAAVTALNISVKELAAKWQNVASVIEGTASNGRSDNPCTYYYNGSAAKYEGQLGVWTSTLGTNSSNALPGIICCDQVNHTNCIQGSHPTGLPTVLYPSGTPAPTCSTLSRIGDNVTGTINAVPKACPCCCVCRQNIDALDAVAARMPTPEQLAMVTPTVAQEALTATIFGLHQYLTKSLDTFQAYFSQLKTVSHICT